MSLSLIMTQCLAWIYAHVDAMPLAAMILFFGISLLVTVYTLTDRRAAHLSRMGAMALDQETGTDACRKDPSHV